MSTIEVLLLASTVVQGCLGLLLLLAMVWVGHPNIHIENVFPQWEEDDDDGEDGECECDPTPSEEEFMEYARKAGDN